MGYLTFAEREELRKETYEHNVRMAEMAERLKALLAESRRLRWQNRWLKFKRFFGQSR